jgi:hypothetical protein
MIPLSIVDDRDAERAGFLQQLVEQARLLFVRTGIVARGT